MYQEVIQFWFEEIDSAFWFRKDEQFDQLLEEKFGNVHRQAAQGELYSWRQTALGSLAEIIVLDQFSRNIYRDKPLSFAFDTMALALAQVAIEKQFDKSLSISQKAFLYMPLMHSESVLIHQEAVKLFSQPGLESNLEFEIKHQQIIEQFGRYPHRNSILNRESTAEELEFLQQPGSSF